MRTTCSVRHGRGGRARHRLLDGVAQEEAEAEGHVLSHLQIAAGFSCGLLVGAEELLDDSLAAEGGHSLDALFGDEIDGAAAGDGLPDVDRAVERAGDQRYVAELVTAVGDIGRDLVVLAVVAEGLLVEGLHDDVDLLLEQLAVGVLVQQGRAEGLDLAGLVATADAEDQTPAGQHIAHGEVLGEGAGGATSGRC